MVRENNGLCSYVCMRRVVWWLEHRTVDRENNGLGSYVCMYDEGGLVVRARGLLIEKTMVCVSTHV